MDQNYDMNIFINQFDNLTPEQIKILYQQQRNSAVPLKKRYIPVAFCIETETEYHDVFREILLSLFEMIRVPEIL